MLERALIVGAGDGLSASVARALAREGTQVGLAARGRDKLAGLCEEIGALSFSCDVSIAEQVENLFSAVDEQMGSVDLVVYNPSFRTSGELVELNPDDVQRALMISAFGGFLVGQQAARRMLAQGHGAILFTGASASVKGYPKSAPFAMGKFALRGLAQSMARELAPKNIHVAHFVIDGGIAKPVDGQPGEGSDNRLDPDAIAETYLHVAKQARSAWTWEVELRPWLENF
jgi:NAD(P)-dependent dehydrogenase (short-subunit alcohol dehydrogenase family)